MIIWNVGNGFQKKLFPKEENFIFDFKQTWNQNQALARFSNEPSKARKRFWILY